MLEVLHCKNGFLFVKNKSNNQIKVIWSEKRVFKPIKNN